MTMSAYPRDVLRVVGIVALLEICFAGIGARAEVNDSKCQTVRELSGVNYWLWEGYVGAEDVVDDGVMLTGRVSSDPDICFRVSRLALEDPLARTQGYKLAIMEWFKQLPREAERWETDPEGYTARQHLKILTGQDFASQEQWTKWWEENNEYLLWSDAVGHLIIDEEAKRAQTPVLEPGEITATQYWFWQARDWLKDIREDDAFMRGQGWTEHGYQKFRIPKGTLTDRTAKEAGYKEAVRGYIWGGVALPGLKDTALEKFMARLRDLTGESFQKREEWMEWWNESKDRLVLSADGRRLVAKAR